MVDGALRFYGRPAAGSDLVTEVRPPGRRPRRQTISRAEGTSGLVRFRVRDARGKATKEDPVGPPETTELTRRDPLNPSSG